LKPKILKYFSLLSILILVISHIPFRSCDPRGEMLIGRDAYTDEGLYSMPARNMMLSDSLNIAQNPTFLYTPLLALTQNISFNIFGATLEVARFTSLILALIPLFILFYFGLYTWILFIIPILYYHHIPFAYSHYALAEMPSLGLILSSIFLLHLYGQSLDRKLLLCSIITLLSAVFFKIQYVYISALIGVYFVVIYFMQKRDLFYFVKVISAVFFFFLSVYFFSIWGYTDTLFLNLQSLQSSTISTSENVWDRCKYNYQETFTAIAIAPWTIYLFLITYFATVFFIIRYNSKYALLLILLSFWLILEFHRFYFVYFPTRYMLSIFFVGLALVSLACVILMEHRYFRAISFLVFISFCIFNSTQYVSSISTRSYSIKHINAYFKTFQNEHLTIYGNWSPTSSWGSIFHTNMMINGSFDYASLSTIPDIIITEADEADSDGAFRNKHIDLNAISDSTRSFYIGKYAIKVYWIKK
jgi:4-amino-4-deoxy-L-arabinose transferase-like glycosyltransferase